jgi:aminopeptidase N
MKFIFTLIFSSLYITAVFSQEEANFHNHCAHSKIQAFANQTAAQHKSLSDQDKYDLHYVKLDLTLDNLSTNIDRGHATHKAIVTNPSLDMYVCELHSNIVVDSAKINGSVVTLNRLGNELQLFPSSFLNAGENFTVDIYYHGAPPNTGSFFGGIFNDVSPSWGASVTWTLSQPFSAYTWWPSKQVLSDKIDSSEVWLTVPNTLKGGSNGLLLNEVNLPGSLKRFEWKHQYPIAYYLISLAVGPYIEYNFYADLPGTNDSVFVQNFIYNNPATLTQFQTEIELTADMIYEFSDLFGLYPFKDEKYGHCMAPLSGGMEHQTMTTQGFFETSLTAHELGHQWFGDLVTCKDWGHIWVNEGFASYSEYVFYETLNNNSAAQKMNDFHNSAMSQAGGSVYVTDQTDENRIFSARLSYDKGAALVHMIRHWVNNDSLFFAACESYLNTYANQVASAEDFIEQVENVSGVSMQNFLSHWYYGEGYPTYSGKFNDANNQLVVRIDQVSSMPNVTPFFASHLDIKIDFLDGSDTIIHVVNTYPGQTFLFNISKDVYAISVDPENWVLNKSNAWIEDANLIHTALLSLENGQIKLYPNPSKEIFTIELENSQNHKLEIFDLLGRKYFEQNINNKIEQIHHKLPSGIYVVQVSFQEQKFIQKIWVE